MPWPILVSLIVVAAVGWIQGLRVASMLQEQRLPARAVRIAAGPAADVVEVPGATGFVIVDLAGMDSVRLALVQALPGRRLVRWIEAPQGPRSDALVLPLEGLSEGEYWLCAVDDSAVAGPSEMDRPEQELDVRRRLRITAR